MSTPRKHEWVYPGGMPGHVVGGIWRPITRACNHCWVREDRKAATHPCPGRREETITDVVYGTVPRNPEAGA